MIAVRHSHRRSFITLDKRPFGVKAMILSLHEDTVEQLEFNHTTDRVLAQHELTPGFARELAAELVRRADELEAKK